MEIIIVVGISIHVKLFLNCVQAVFGHALQWETGQEVAGLQDVLGGQGFPLTWHCKNTRALITYNRAGSFVGSGKMPAFTESLVLLPFWSLICTLMFVFSLSLCSFLLSVLILICSTGVFLASRIWYTSYLTFWLSNFHCYSWSLSIYYRKDRAFFSL